jgi:leucyl aminopeptidase
MPTAAFAAPFKAVIALGLVALAPAGALPASAQSLSPQDVLAQPISFRAAGLGEDSAIVVPVAEGPLSGIAAQADAASGGAIARAISAAEFKAKPGDVLTLYSIGRFARVTLIGVGAGAITATDLEDFGARAAIASSTGAAGVAVVFAPDAPGLQNDPAIAARGAALGGYAFGEAFDRAKPKADRGLIFAAEDAAAAQAAFNADGRALIAGVALARDLISEPSNIKTPQWFADRVRTAFRGEPKVTIEVLDERQMQRLNMGLLLGVGQGSTRPPRLVLVRYNGAPATEAPIAFVGKGITFDSGGISIKPGDGMWRMRYDMSGAAASMGAVMSLARRGAPVNAIGVAALAENMPGGGAIRPGDVLKSYTGKTVEVLNTDAEGRLVLADALAYVQDKHKPSAVITIATLTGAVRTALGDDYAGLFANDESLAARVTAAGAATNEAVWRLPIHESTFTDIKSDVADVKNVVEGTGTAGASIGAAFIQEWVRPGQAWAHLDIAGVAWKTARTPTVPAGAAGYGVRLLDQLARDGAGAP